ncbi:MAG: hypothetical protein ABSG14_13165 [Verrucomicrobiia bacterium]|jgi:hypothetical protein
METYRNTAIVFGGLKDALLHFEYVIPMNLSGEFVGLRPARGESGGLVEKFRELGMDGYRELKDSFGEPDALLNLYPPQLAKHPFFKDAVNMFNGFLMAYMFKAVYGDEKFRAYVGHLAQIRHVEKPIDPDKFCPTVEDLQRLFSALVGEFGLQNIPVDCSCFYMGSVKDAPFTDRLFVRQICVIDTSKVTVPQIMEFRKDRETMNKMRNFRLFAYEQYSGKDRAYIEDDIQRRLSDYNEAVKACGFETMVKTLSFLFESKLLIGAFATSAVSLLMGNARLAMEAFGSGAILEVGRLSLEYARQRHELGKICRENPISYIADTKKKLGDFEG